MMDWQDKNIAVLGFGVEGRSSCAFFLRRGAHVTVHDDRADGSITNGVDKAISFALGGDAFSGLEEADLVVRSPGVNPSHHGLQGLMPEKVTSQTEIFLQRWHHRSIGITGSKGKGTTTSLLAHMLELAGQRVSVGGNIGTPLLDIFENMNDSSWAVLELSSFQLQDVTVSPHVAVMLMVTSEHLDYHGDIDSYVAAKANILRHQTGQDVAVVASDYPLTEKAKVGVRGQLLTYGRSADNDAVLTDCTVHLQGAEAQLSLAESKLIGSHNLENIAAAALTARSLGVDMSIIRSALASFEPLPHRLQPVAVKDGVAFVNDSFATTPESVMAAVKSVDAPVILVVGGTAKGTDLTGLIEFLLAQAEDGRLGGLITIGETGRKIADGLRHRKAVPLVESLAWMSEIVVEANRLARLKGENTTVLLSPGAASFGLFKDYKDRGEQFVAAVHRL